MRTIGLALLWALPMMCCGTVKEDTLAVEKADTLSLLFAGDLMQHQAQIDAARTTNRYDYSDCFKWVKDEISRADLAIGNLEVTLGGKPYKGYPAFSAPDEYLYAIRDAGFDVLTTANNHCLDSGRKGLQRTIHLLDSLGIPRAGTYVDAEDRTEKYPLMLERKGFRIVLLSYTYGTNGLSPVKPNMVNYIDTTLMARDIEASKAKHPDAIIACMHWGVEYQSLPNKEQKFLADWLLRKGVTHVIGSHPHVVQPMEVREDSVDGSRHLVVYSLGNYISNMSVRRTDGGLMVRLDLVKKGDEVRLADCGYSMVWTARPIQSGKKNFQLLPVNIPSDSVTERAYKSLKIFADDSRALFKQHNKGIEEHYFYGKKE